MIRIVRYTEKVQRTIGSNTKPEPWLHLVIDIRMDKGQHSKATASWAIYVWDTRQIIESKENVQMHTGQFLALLNPNFIGSALDNHQPLKGCNSKLLQDAVKQHQNKDVRIEAEEYQTICESAGISK